MPEIKQIGSFQEAILNDPVVHAYMTQQIHGENGKILKYEHMSYKPRRERAWRLKI